MAGTGGGDGTGDDGKTPSGQTDMIPDGGGSGGGATHIATQLRGSEGRLTSYKNYQSEVLIVAGGGGGAASEVDGGTGGGTKGGKPSGGSNKTVNQTEGYAFGKGEDGEGIGDSNGVAGGRRRLVWWIY